MVQDQLAATGPKALQIRVGGVESTRSFLVGRAFGNIDVGGEGIPGGILENHVTEIVLNIDGAGTLAWPIAYDPRQPAIRSVLSPGHQPRENLLPVRVPATGIEFL